jgi:putative transposase
MIRQMSFELPLILYMVPAVFKDRADLVAENLALRHQLSCFIHRGPRPRIRPVDRVFWVLLSRFWDGWRESLAVVKPATVLAWHRKGFKLLWRWKSRKRGPGRPRISAEVRKLIVAMAQLNVGWGAPRIHGELLKLGIEISEITVSRYMPKRPPPAGSRQRWATFLGNHLHETLAIDFAVVPTATFGIVYVFFVLSLERRRVLHFNVTGHPTAEWTAQQVVIRCGLIGPSSPARSICLGAFWFVTMTRSMGQCFVIEWMGLASNRYVQLFDLLGRTDLRRDGFPVYEGTA